MIRRLLVIAAPLAALALIGLAGAGQDQGGKARKLLTDLESERAAPALSGDAAVPKLALDAANEPIAQARKLLERADELRRLGDVPRAEIAEDAALEWAETARDVVKAIALEHGAAYDEAASGAAISKAEKARAALEAAVSLRAKLQAELDTLDSELAAKALDGGAEAGPKKTKKSKGPLP
ncbi:MAG: hypothetical protein ACXVEF_30625 [Polyangiales bacterium]